MLGHQIRKWNETFIGRIERQRKTQTGVPGIFEELPNQWIGRHIWNKVWADIVYKHQRRGEPLLLNSFAYKPLFWIWN